MANSKNKKTLKDLPEDWEDIVMEMMTEGKLEKQVIAEFGLSREVHARFCKSYPEYQKVFNFGNQLAEDWWIEQGRANLQNRNFNNALYLFVMKSQFNWIEKNGSGGKNTGKPTEDNLKKAKVLEQFKTDDKPEKASNIN